MYGGSHAGHSTAAVAAETTLSPDTADVEELVTFLAANDLIRAQGPEARRRLQRQAASQRRHPAAWLVKNYLFVRVPLVRPERFLNAAYPLVRPLYTRTAGVVFLLAALLGLYLAGRQWDSFTNTLLHMFTWQGAGLFAVALVVAKLIHELGHAFTAHRYGCRVPTMGVAFLVMWPVLYTDTSDAWAVPSRRARLAIGAAGMLAELGVAAVATLAWSFLPDGPARSAAFLLATTTWVGTIIINLTPFMRFDGYYLLCDWLGEENLFDRSFAFGRWKLRELLFGFGDPPPEPLPDRRRRFMVAFGWGVWVYRFFLFLGIALLVYHLFFKLLGVVLMVVELGAFIGLPIWRELRAWGRERHRIRPNRNSLIAAGLLVLLVALAAVPWRTRIAAPGVLVARDHAVLYAPRGARVESLPVAEGDPVTEGDRIATLTAPDLAHQLAQAERRVRRLEWEASASGASDRLRARRLVSETTLAQARQTLSGLEAEAADLILAAPFDGTVVRIAGDLEPGQWVAEDAPLATLVDRGSVMVEAYVAEADLGRIPEAATARFIPDEPEQPKMPLRLSRLETVASGVLERPVLASAHGGRIATRRDRDDRLIPEDAVYRAVLHPVDDTRADPRRIMRGTVMIDGAARSLIDRLWTSIVTVLVRETGF